MFHRLIVVTLTIVAILAAGWLVLRRADVPYDTLETMYSVRDTQFLTLESGLKVHFTDTGPRDGMALIMVHGFSSSLHTWQTWKSDLEKDFRVITFDLPGHGLTRSEAPEQARMTRFAEVTDQLADKLGVDMFTLIGHSMGGKMAWNYASLYGERLDSLVLIAASGWPPSAEERSSNPIIFRLLENPLARFIIKDLDMTYFVRSAAENSYVDQSFVTEELINRYALLTRAPGHRETLIALSSDESIATPELLSSIDVETLVLSGDSDKLVSVEHAKAFAEHIPGAELIIYENVGHLPHEEKAAESLLDLRAFLLDVEWGAVQEEEIEPAGDPRLQENR